MISHNPVNREETVMRIGDGKKQYAQDAIIQAAVSAALVADERGFTDVAKEIRKEATRLAKRYGLFDVPGLPATFRK